MKKVVYLFAVAGLLMTSFSMTSCSKDGDTGPAGEQGAQGDKGDKGDKGDQGDQGEIGTANVIYSQWLDVTFEDGIGVIPAPKLDSAMLNGGSMKVYVNVGTEEDPLVVSLPTSLGNGENAPIQITPFFMLNNIVLSSNYNVSTGLDNEGNKTFIYRYVLIPGGTNAVGVNWNDYGQVKKFVGIR